jgi:AcrR family transcriptional regulator
MSNNGYPAAMSSTSAPAFTRLDPEGRRRQIVDAARAVFSERPYNAVSMNDVARSAGVTRGLIHHYFGGKTQLFGAVVQSLAELAPSLVTTEHNLPLEDMVSIGVDAWLDFVSEHRELALAVGAAGMYPDDPALQGIVHAARDEIVKRIIANLRPATGESPELRFLIRSYLGLADATAREWLHRRRATRQDVHTMLTQTLIALIETSLPALTHGD